MGTSNSDGKLWVVAAYISGAGFLLVISVFVGFFGTRWLVEQFDGPRYWIAIGTISGLLLGIVNMIVLIKKFMGAQNG
ncbi:putative F0F1-ATPase subunit [compost metagenome]